MELALALVRAGACKSDLAGRLVGVSDEPLAQESRRFILERRETGVYPSVKMAFAGGSARCFETARLIWPSVTIVVEKELRPLDYGVYEGEESCSLPEDKRFLEWAAIRQAGAFPGGESPHAMLARSAQAFCRVTAEMASKGIESAAIVSHHLVIQSILQRYCIPRSGFRNWEVGYGCGFFAIFDTVRAMLQIDGVF